MLLRRFVQRPHLAWLALALSFVVARLLLLPVLPAPDPGVHDEFGYLLAADAFAHGHIAAPSPAHPDAFSAAHLLVTPAYTSIYQPGQGLVLAVGQVLFGHPYAGVLLSTAAFLFLLCWAASPWLPSHWTVMTGVLAWCLLFLRSYWTESYWGGTVAACGGALMLGVLGRALRSDWKFPWFAMGLGAVVLLLTRPYEGGMFGLAVACALLWRARRFGSVDRRHLAMRIVLPSAALLIATIAALGWYNAQITGNPLELPYATYSKQYSMTPPLWPMPDYGEKQYVDAPRAAIHQRDFRDYQALAKSTWPKLIAMQFAKFLTPTLWEQFQLVGLILLALPFVRLHPRLSTVKFLVAAGFFTLFLEVWLFPHYSAPFTAVQYVAIIAVTRTLWYRMSMMSTARAGLILVPVLSVVLFPLGMSWLGTTMRQPNQRTQFIRKMEQTGGRHLVFTEYAAGWNLDYEWVYNGFDFNERQVMFARWHGEDEMRAIVRDYPGRKVWRLTLGPKLTDQHLEPVTLPNSDAGSVENNKIASKN